MWPSPASRLCLAFASVTSSLAHRDASRSDAAQPRDRVDQLGLPVAVDAGDADDLPTAHLEREPAHLLEPTIVAHVQVLDPEQRLARCRHTFLDAQQHLAPDHQPGELLLGRPSGRQRLDLLPAPQHRHPVGDLEHLVQLVADEDDRHPLLRERAEDLEQLLGLLGGQDGGRLVQDEDVGVPVERLQDLDALLLTDRDVLDPRVRIDLELEGVGQVADALGGGVVVEQHLALGGLVREHDVLRHRHHGNQHEVLVHHADAAVDGVARRAHPRRLALDPDLALVGVIQAVEDVHQRRLAGAVLAQQRMHFAEPEIEADVVVGDDPGEALRDSPQLENWLRIGGPLVHGPLIHAGDPNRLARTGLAGAV